ncbi:MAG: ribonuclease HII [Rickettsiaceae bacterium]|nr:ribonuclease HII [Rickettsiaceae bacterium]
MTDLEIEQRFFGKIIAGVDEAGRGPLAGPVVAAAVIVDQNNIIEGIRDSKKLSKKKREDIYHYITSHYIWSVGIVSSDEIDEINILQATIKACRLAVSALKVRADIVLVDGNMKFGDQRFLSIIKGDDKSISIAAASIIAKVTRDGLMNDLSNEFPEYKWHQNAGYGTKEHMEAIIKHGRSVHHRKSFKVKDIV